MKSKDLQIAKNAPDSLRLLWSRDFFKAWKNFGQIVKKLSEDGYNFSNAEFGMALKRCTHLTRKGKRGAYEYIQKYPFIEDEKKSK